MLDPTRFADRRPEAWPELITARPTVIDQVTQPIDRQEVLRYLGYPADRRPAAELATQIDRWIDLGCELAEPSAVYLILPVVGQDAKSLSVSSSTGERTFHGSIGAFLGEVKLLLVFIATAGSQIEALASDQLRGGDAFAALTLGAVGSERAEAAEEAALADVRPRVSGFGLDVTLPYSPGYCGMRMEEQRTLFSLFEEYSLFDGMTAGVTLTQDCLMQPIKSVSGIVGIADAETMRPEPSPCDRCELKGCNMRRSGL